MNKEELLKLREQIAGQTRSLALTDTEDVDPSTKLQVLMNLIRAGDTSGDILYKAFETAQQLQEAPLKLDAMLDLIYEIDAELAADEPVPEQQSEAQPEQQQ